jgi:uncharacterized protein YvpB
VSQCATGVVQLYVQLQYANKSIKEKILNRKTFSRKIQEKKIPFVIMGGIT